MSSTEFRKLSRRERQIMELLVQHDELTVQEVTDQMPDAPSYTTVRTLMRILEEKGYIKHIKTGKRFLYQPVNSPEKIRRHSFQHLLKTFFGGSLTEAVATFINHPDTRLSEEELAELERIVRQAKEKDKE